MAEGYSIAEAAKLLGVPQRRVMQLLERGVLMAAVDDRRRWRVYLTAGATSTADVAEASPGSGADPSAPNGGADTNGDHFSQLLAELRHLQERYGQALLALGEARGETAALRSRVELLEGGPALAVPAPEAAPEAPEVAPQPAAAAPPRATVRRRRAGAQGAAAGFAEALARADDPSAPELPGGREAARAMDALAASQPSASPPAPPPPRPDAEPMQPPAQAESSAPDRGIGRLRRWLGR